MITKKQYQTGEIQAHDLSNNHAYWEWLREHNMGLTNRLFADHRKTMPKIFKRPRDWSYKGTEHFFHVWVHDHDGEIFLILTAKGKGTCYETINIKNTKAILSFLEMINKALTRS